MEAQNRQSGLGIASLVLGIIGMMTSCIIIGVIPCIIGIIFSIIALFSKNKKGTAIAGLICSSMGIFIFGLFLVFVMIGGNSNDKAQNNQSGQKSFEKESDVDMRERLTDSSFYFSLNSVGGIEFSFSAKNSTGKEIKYVRFDVELRNAVGDLVKDEITRTTSESVEIVGPVKSGSEVKISDKIIGYCETCARIDINDITIIYMDGTSETGRFGYYYEKK